MKSLSPFRTIIISIAIILFCFSVARDFNIDLFSHNESKQLNITFRNPNSSPELIEQKVTSVLENILSQLRDLKDINSISSYDYGLIQLYFDKNTDIEFKKFEVISLLRQSKDQLPKEMDFPQVIQGEEVQDGSYDKTPLLIYTVNSNRASSEIKKTVEDAFRKTLNSIDEIGRIEVSGGSSRQITVVFDKYKIRSFGIELTTLISVLQSQTKDFYPGHTMNINGDQLFIKVSNVDFDISSFGDIVILPKPGLRLRDIAKFYFEEPQANEYFRINGENSIIASIYAKEDINALTLAKSIKHLLPQVLQKLPPDFEVRLNLDSTDFFQEELNKNQTRMVLALLIILIFIFFSYKSWKLLLITVLSLMVSISLTLLIISYLKIQIYIYTLAGLTISFGIIINHTIVVLDYFGQYKKRSIILALVTSTLITISTLSLFFLLPKDKVSQVIDFSLVVSISLVASVISNFFFTIGLYKLFYPDKYESKLKRPYNNRIIDIYSRLIAFIAKNRKVFIILLVLTFGLPIFLLPEKLSDNQLYNNTIGSKMYQEKIRPELDKWTGGIWRLFDVFVYKSSYYRDPGKTILHIEAELPIGNTIDQMNSIIENIERYLSKNDGIDSYITNIYSGQKAEIKVSFKENADAFLPTYLKNRIKTKVSEWGGVKWNVYGVGKGFSNRTFVEVPNFRIKMLGYNFDELESQAKKMSAMLIHNKRIPKVEIDAKSSYDQKEGKEYLLTLNPEIMGIKNVRATELFSALTSISKPYGFHLQINMNDKLVPVLFKEKHSDDYSKWDMLNSSTHLNPYLALRIKNLGDVELNRTYGSIVKENRQYVRILEFDYMGSYEAGANYIKSCLLKFTNASPIGYTAKLEQFKRKIDFDYDQYIILILMLVLNYILCAIFFEDLILPIFIIILIPISYIGLFLSFYLFDFSFDQGGYAAFLMTSSLIINSGVYILYDLKEALKYQANYNQTIIAVLVNRGRTILLITITTICGLIPFLLDGPSEVFWFSLAIGTIGGLTFSLFAIFITLPVLLWLNPKQKLE